MGRYLELVKETFAELKAGQETAPAQEPLPRLYRQDSESEPTLDYDVNDRNDQRVRGDRLPSWADPAVPATRREAERPGVLDRGAADFLGLDAYDDASETAWVSGAELDALPESLQTLVKPRTGWTANHWRDYLRRRLALCDGRHQDVARLYEQAAILTRNDGTEGQILTA